MSYNKLVNISYQKQTCFERDQVELNSRGITPAAIANLIACREAFINIPTKKTTVATIGISKEERQAIATELKALMKEVWGIAKNTFGSKDANYKTFRPTSISLVNATDLYNLADIALRRGQLYFTMMQPKGFSSAMLYDIDRLRTKLKAAIENTTQSKGNNIITAEARINAANALFDTIRDMCNTAFVYFENRNKLKASQYIIYKTTKKHTQRSGGIAVNTTISRKISEIKAASSFKIQVLSGGELSFYFSKTIGGVAGTKKIVVPVTEDAFTIVKAADLGFNERTGFVHFCIHNAAIVGEKTRYKIWVK